ncbi:MAG: hypothetical protein DMG76_04990 [Acidobacteria bacterium]|nr:MAG: hypothetical protein DMG76_04990 [Acidobacteriota bacterium]
MTSRCSPQHCAQMRPCTAGQKRFSLRISQMAQLKTQTPLSHYGIPNPRCRFRDHYAKGSSGEFLLSDHQGGPAKRPFENLDLQNSA